MLREEGTADRAPARLHPGRCGPWRGEERKPGLDGRDLTEHRQQVLLVRPERESQVLGIACVVVVREGLGVEVRRADADTQRAEAELPVLAPEEALEERGPRGFAHPGEVLRAPARERKPEALDDLLCG